MPQNEALESLPPADATEAAAASHAGAAESGGAPAAPLSLAPSSLTPPGCDSDAVVESHLVGRTCERSFLLALLSRVSIGDESHVVLVEAEAGVGKSALIYELLEEAEARGIAFYFGSASEQQKRTPYFAWRSIFEQLLGLESLGAQPTRRRRLLEGILSDELLAWGALLNPILQTDFAETDFTAHMTTESRANNLQRLLVAVLGETAQAAPASPRTRQQLLLRDDDADASAALMDEDAFVLLQPRVLVLESLHWFDSGSWELLVSVCELLPNLLILLTSRPLLTKITHLTRLERMRGEVDATAVGADEEEVSEACFHRLALRELDHNEILTLAWMLLGGSRPDSLMTDTGASALQLGAGLNDAPSSMPVLGVSPPSTLSPVVVLPPALCTLLFETCRGNPLYLEELCRSLAEEGVVVVHPPTATTPFAITFAPDAQTPQATGKRHGSISGPAKPGATTAKAAGGGGATGSAIVPATPSSSFSMPGATGSLLPLHTLTAAKSVLQLMVSRLDRLPQQQQLTLKVASVIGLDFSLEQLRCVHPMHHASSMMKGQALTQAQQEAARQHASMLLTRDCDHLVASGILVADTSATAVMLPSNATDTNDTTSAPAGSVASSGTNQADSSSTGASTSGSGDAPVAAPVYSFKHAMMREAAYSMLSLQQRLALHEQCALYYENSLSRPRPSSPSVAGGAAAASSHSQMAAIMATSIGGAPASRRPSSISSLAELPSGGVAENRELEPYYSVLCHHWMAAEQWQRALVYTLRSASLALAVNANHEAVKMSELGLDILAKIGTAKPTAATTASTTTSPSGTVTSSSGALPTAVVVADYSPSLSPSSPDHHSAALLSIHSNLGAALYSLGRYERSIVHLEAALTLLGVPIAQAAADASHLRAFAAALSGNGASTDASLMEPEFKKLLKQQLKQWESAAAGESSKEQAQRTSRAALLPSSSRRSLRSCLLLLEKLCRASAASCLVWRAAYAALTMVRLAEQLMDAALLALSYSQCAIALHELGRSQRAHVFTQRMQTLLEQIDVPVSRRVPSIGTIYADAANMLAAAAAAASDGPSSPSLSACNPPSPTSLLGFPSLESSPLSSIRPLDYAGLKHHEALLSAYAGNWNGALSSLVTAREIFLRLSENKRWRESTYLQALVFLHAARWHESLTAATALALSAAQDGDVQSQLVGAQHKLLLSFLVDGTSIEPTRVAHVQTQLDHMQRLRDEQAEYADDAAGSPLSGSGWGSTTVNSIGSDDLTFQLLQLVHGYALLADPEPLLSALPGLVAAVGSPPIQLHQFSHFFTLFGLCLDVLDKSAAQAALNEAIKNAGKRSRMRGQQFKTLPASLLNIYRSQRSNSQQSAAAPPGQPTAIAPVVQRQQAQESPQPAPQPSQPLQQPALHERTAGDSSSSSSIVSLLPFGSASAHPHGTRSPTAPRVSVPTAYLSVRPPSALLSAATTRRLMSSVEKLLDKLGEFALTFPPAAPWQLLYGGRVAWLQGKHAKAVKQWKAAAEAGRKQGALLLVATAFCQLGAHPVPPDNERERNLAQSYLRRSAALLRKLAINFSTQSQFTAVHPFYSPPVAPPSQLTLSPDRRASLRAPDLQRLARVDSQRQSLGKKTSRADEHSTTGSPRSVVGLAGRFHSRHDSAGMLPVFRSPSTPLSGSPVLAASQVAKLDAPEQMDTVSPLVSPRSSAALRSVPITPAAKLMRRSSVMSRSQLIKEHGTAAAHFLGSSPGSPQQQPQQSPSAIGGGVLLRASRRASDSASLLMFQRQFAEPVLQRRSFGHDPPNPRRASRSTGLPPGLAHTVEGNDDAPTVPEGDEDDRDSDSDSQMDGDDGRQQVRDPGRAQSLEVTATPLSVDTSDVVPLSFPPLLLDSPLASSADSEPAATTTAEASTRITPDVVVSTAAASVHAPDVSSAVEASGSHLAQPLSSRSDAFAEDAIQSPTPTRTPTVEPAANGWTAGTNESGAAEVGTVAPSASPADSASPSGAIALPVLDCTSPSSVVAGAVAVGGEPSARAVSASHGSSSHSPSASAVSVSVSASAETEERKVPLPKFSRRNKQQYRLHVTAQHANRPARLDVASASVRAGVGMRGLASHHAHSHSLDGRMWDGAAMSPSHLSPNTSDGRALPRRYGQPRLGAELVGSAHSARRASISAQQASLSPSAARDSDPSPSPRENHQRPSPRSVTTAASAAAATATAVPTPVDDDPADVEHYVYTMDAAAPDDPTDD